MGRHVQLILGPAGSGKSTYCRTMQQHLQAAKRNVNVINLDPAAESIPYSVSADVRDLISLDDVTGEDLGLGPNGGLVFCMEYLTQHMEWLSEEMDKVGGSDDEYFLIDCPGQVELFTHMPVMRTIVESLKQWDYSVCAVHLIDAVFIDDPAKYISGTMMALSTMVQLEVAHINLISKCDLLETREGGADEAVEPFLAPDTGKLRETLNEVHVLSSQRYRKLNDAICNLIDDFSMVQFVPLNWKDEESVELCLAHIDHALQYGEDVEPKDPGDLLDEPDEKE